MAEGLTCANCGRSIRRSWLVCHSCNQPRWKRILGIFIWGAVFTVFSLLAVPLLNEPALPGLDGRVTMPLQIASVILGMIGVVMLVTALFNAMRGFSVKKVKPATLDTSGQAAGATEKVTDISELKMVIPLSGGVLPGVDDTILRGIDDHIRYANGEKDWNANGFTAGQVKRADIPFNTLSIIDHLLVDHALTSDTTLAHLNKLGDDGLRERIILVLGAMSTTEVLPVLEKIAESDPCRRTYNRDESGNMTYADNSDYTYPLRDLALKMGTEVNTRLQAAP